MKGQTGKRKAYRKPALRRVNLVADEVLALGCKTDTGPTGPISASCTTIPCVTLGS
jgi:hypothetical protein